MIHHTFDVQRSCECLVDFGEHGVKIKPGEDMTLGSVVGAAPSPLSLRRHFAAYLDDVRASPYHQLLHYNRFSEMKSVRSTVHTTAAGTSSGAMGCTICRQRIP